MNEGDAADVDAPMSTTTTIEHEDDHDEDNIDADDVNDDDN